MLVGNDIEVHPKTTSETNRTASPRPRPSSGGNHVARLAAPERKRRSISHPQHVEPAPVSKPKPPLPQSKLDLLMHDVDHGPEGSGDSTPLGDYPLIAYGQDLVEIVGLKNIPLVDDDNPPEEELLERQETKTTTLSPQPSRSHALTLSGTTNTRGKRVFVNVTVGTEDEDSDQAAGSKLLYMLSVSLPTNAQDLLSSSTSTSTPSTNPPTIITPESEFLAGGVCECSCPCLENEESIFTTASTEDNTMTINSFDNDTYLTSTTPDVTTISSEDNETMTSMTMTTETIEDEINEEEVDEKEQVEEEEEEEEEELEESTYPSSSSSSGTTESLEETMPTSTVRECPEVITQPPIPPLILVAEGLLSHRSHQTPLTN